MLMSTIRPLFLTLSILFCFRNAEAQAVRLDSFSSTTNAQCAPGVQCPLLVIPGTQVNFCNGNAVGVVSTSGTVVTLVSPGPSFIGAAGTIQIAGTSYPIATVVSSSILVLSPPGAGTQTNVPYSSLSGCLGNPVTTYTSSSAGTSCGTTSQLTPQLGGACVATADNQGNYGAWFLPGSYYYYLRTPATAGGIVSGPYPITLGASAGTPAGATVDANYATLALGCAAAGSGTLYVTELWNNTPTQTLACGLNFLGNGKIQTATSATVTITGSVTAPFNQQIFDSTTNSGSTFIFSGTKLAAIYDQWWGTSSLVPACGAGGGTGAPVYITMAWLNVPNISCAGFLNFQLTGSIQPAASAFFATRGYTAVTRQTVWDLSNSGSSIRISSPAMGQQLYASNFSTFAGACSTAATYGSSLTVQLPITALTTQACAASLIFVGTGAVQPASGQTVTIILASAPLSRVCDISVGGGAACIITSAGGMVHPEWWGNVAQGTATDDAVPINAALNNFGNASLGTNLVSGPAVVLSGGYSIATSIVAQNKSLTFMCDGWGTTLATVPACYIASQAGLSGSPEIIIRNSMGFKIQGIRFIGSVANPPSAAIVFDQEAGTPNELNQLQNVYIGENPSFDTGSGQQFTEGIVFSGINANNGQNIGTNIWIYGVGIGIDLQHGEYGLNQFHDIEIWNSGTCAVKSATRVKLSEVFFFHSLTADLCGTPGTSNDGNANFDIEYWGSEQSARLADFAQGTGSYYGWLQATDGYFLANDLNVDGKFITGLGTSSQQSWFGWLKNFNLDLQGYAAAQTQGSVSSGSTALTVVSGTGIANGQTITASGPGIPSGTTVTGSGTSWTLSTPATATISGAALNFFASGVSVPTIDLSHNSAARVRELHCDGCFGMTHNNILQSSEGNTGGDFNWIDFWSETERWVALGNTAFNSTNPGPFASQFNTIIASNVAGSGSAPACAYGTGSGTTGPCAQIAGTNFAGTIAVTTAGTPSADAPIATITFANGGFSVIGFCQLTYANKTSAVQGPLSGIYPDNFVTTVMVIHAGDVPLPAGAVSYQFNYLCAGQ